MHDGAHDFLDRDGEPRKENEFIDYLVENEFAVDPGRKKYVKVYLKEDRFAPENPEKFGYTVKDVQSLKGSIVNTVIEYEPLQHYIARSTVEFENHDE
jgi:hypothetical protein